MGTTAGEDGHKEEQANQPYSMETLRETSEYTSLISLKLLPNDSMTKAKEMLDSERATTGKAVLKSLKNLLHILSYHTSTILCRYVHQRDHNLSALPFTLVDIPPRQEYLYWATH